MTNLNISGITENDIEVPTSENVGFPEPIQQSDTQVGYKQCQCPKCGTVYTVPVYMVDMECNSRPDGVGCKGNHVKYYSSSAGGYTETYLPFVFDCGGGES